MTKYFEKLKLKKFLNHLNDPTVNYPEGYLEFHKDRIGWLQWLIHSYEGKAGDPKMLLEALINSNLNGYEDYVNEMKRFNVTPMSETDRLKDLIKHINFLYNWVHYKKITGF